MDSRTRNTSLCFCKCTPLSLEAYFSKVLCTIQFTHCSLPLWNGLQVESKISNVFTRGRMVKQPRAHLVGAQGQQRRLLSPEAAYVVMGSGAHTLSDVEVFSFASQPSWRSGVVFPLHGVFVFPKEPGGILRKCTLIFTIFCFFLINSS